MIRELSRLTRRRSRYLLKSISRRMICPSIKTLDASSRVTLASQTAPARTERSVSTIVLTRDSATQESVLTYSKYSTTKKWVRRSTLRLCPKIKLTNALKKRFSAGRLLIVSIARFVYLMAYLRDTASLDIALSDNMNGSLQQWNPNQFNTIFTFY